MARTLAALSELAPALSAMAALVSFLARPPPEAVAAVSFALFGSMNLAIARLCEPLQELARPKERNGFAWALASRITAVVHAIVITSMGISVFRRTGGSLSTLVWTGTHGRSELACMAVSAGFFVQDFIYMVAKDWDHVFGMHHRCDFPTDSDCFATDFGLF